MSEISVIILITLMVFLMFMSLATTVPSTKASLVFLVLGLLALLFNHLICYALMEITGSAYFPVSTISVSSVIYTGWTYLILRKQKKIKTIK